MVTFACLVLATFAKIPLGDCATRDASVLGIWGFSPQPYPSDSEGAANVIDIHSPHLL